MKYLTISLFLLLSSILFANDEVQLLNCEIYHGEVLKIDQCKVHFKTVCQTLIIDADSIDYLKFECLDNEIYVNYINDLTLKEKCLRGHNDAKNLYNYGIPHFILGVLFGPFTVVGTLVATPTPNKSQATMKLSENKELFGDPSYLECYKKEAKSKNLSAALAGWTTWIVIALLAFR
jgi:hypothetical protein